MRAIEVFLRDRCVLDGYTLLEPSELLAAYRDWAAERGAFQMRTVGQLGRHLQLAGVRLTITQPREFGRKRLYEGVRLKNVVSSKNNY